VAYVVQAAQHVGLGQVELERIAWVSWVSFGMGMVLRTNLEIIQDWLILLVVGRCCSWFLPQPEKQNHFIVIVVICCKVVSQVHGPV